MNHGKAYLAAQKKCWPACWSCHEALRKARSRYTYNTERGTTDSLVPLDATRKALRILVRRHGFSLAGISRHTSVTPTAIARIAAINRRPPPGQRYVRASLEAAVLSLLEEQKTVLAARRRSDETDPTLTRLALEGLMLQGWTLHHVADQTGVGYYTLTEILRGQHKGVTHATQAKVVDFTRRTGVTQGPSTRCRAMAQRRGYRSTAYIDELL